MMESFIIGRIEKKLIEKQTANSVNGNLFSLTFCLDQIQQISLQLDSRIERLKQMQEKPYLI